MKRIGKTIGVMMVLIVAHGGICFCEATPAESSFVLVTEKSPFKISFEPVSHPKSSGPVDLQFQVRPLFDCDKATVTVASVHKLEYSGPMSWVAEFKDDSTYSTVFQVVIPPNDTSSIEVQVKGCGHWNHAFVYFVTTGDTVEVTPGNPRGYQGIPYTPKTNDPIRDTLTEKQLETEYEIWLDLRDSAHLKIAEKILGPLPNTSKVKGHEGYYILKIPFETILKLGEQGIELDRVKDKKTTRSTNDSFPKKQPQVDSPNGQTALPISPDGISLDSVDGSGTINTADLTYLVDCLFGSPLGPPPPPCQ